MQPESCKCALKFIDDTHAVVTLAFEANVEILSHECSTVKLAKEELRSVFKLLDLVELKNYFRISFKQIGKMKFPSPLK